MRYALSQDAQNDIRNIYRFGIARFGHAAADLFIDALFDVFDDIANRPLSFPRIETSDNAYRRAVHRVNSIYYRVDDERDEVLVIRILGRQDPASLLG